MSARSEPPKSYMGPTQISSARRGTVSLVPKRSPRNAVSPPVKKSQDLLSTAYLTAATAHIMSNPKGSQSARGPVHHKKPSFKSEMTPRSREKQPHEVDAAALPQEFYDKAYGLYGLPPLSRPRSLNTNGKNAPSLPAATMPSRKVKPSLDALEAAVMTQNSLPASHYGPDHDQDQQTATIFGSGYEEMQRPYSEDQSEYAQFASTYHEHNQHLTNNQEKISFNWNPNHDGEHEHVKAVQAQQTPTEDFFGNGNANHTGVRTEFSYGRHQQDSLGLFPSPRRSDPDDLNVSAVRQRNSDHLDHSCPSGPSSSDTTPSFHPQDIPTTLCSIPGTFELDGWRNLKSNFDLLVALRASARRKRSSNRRSNR